ncbi:hypothetical protein CL630_01940 [bacterium]|nr:hypothetical protein [bacterium]
MKLKIKRIIKILKLFREAFGEYKLRIGILVVIGFTGGLFEGIGLNALVTLFSFATGEEVQGVDFISKFIKKAFSLAHVDFNITYLLIFIVILFLLRAVVLFIGTYVKIKITSDYEKNTRTLLFQKTINSSWPYLLSQKTGHLEKTLSVEIEGVMGLLSTLSASILTVTTMLVYLLIAFNISPLITVITFSFGVVTLLVFIPIVLKIKKIVSVFRKINRSVAHLINESMSGIKTIKAMSVGQQIVDIGNRKFLLLRDLRIKRFLISAIPTLFIQPISLILILVLFSVSYKTSNFNLPAFIVVVYLIQKIFVYVQSMQGNLNKISSAIPYLEGILKYQHDITKWKEVDERGAPVQFNDSLSLKNVSFAYKTGTKTVLEDINFEIKKGEFIGLISPSGSGKTTIVDLILRLLAPTSGEIFLDGVAISDIDAHSFRRSIGYVSQDIYLINDTVSNNIRFYDSSIGDIEIRRAAKMANIENVIGELPDGFETIIGERGVILSAGQRQRIIIARVLARKPQLLILDEATSALDNESEFEIQKSIEGLKGKTTVLVIAHRLGTVLNCDKLLVLQDGKITEKGTPQELLNKKDSYFFKMYNIRK